MANYNLFLPVSDSLIKISTDDIIFLESSSNHTTVRMADQIINVPRPLKQFEAQLPINHFIRIHKSYIINIKKIKTVIKPKPSKVILCNNMELPLSENRKDNFFEKLESFAIFI